MNPAFQAPRLLLFILLISSFRALFLLRWYVIDAKTSITQKCRDIGYLNDLFCQNINYSATNESAKKHPGLRRAFVGAHSRPGCFFANAVPENNHITFSPKAIDVLAFFTVRPESSMSWHLTIKAFQIRCIDKNRLCQPLVGSLPSELPPTLDEKIRIVTGTY